MHLQQKKKDAGAQKWENESYRKTHLHPQMDTTQRPLVMQRWNCIQYEIIPDLLEDVGVLTPKLMKVIHILEWVRIEEFVRSTWNGIGRPPHDRQMLASAFVAKTVLGIKTTVGLIERLAIDKALRRICGFPRFKKLPSEGCFSRAFAEFAEDNLAERAHKSLVKEHLGDSLIGHISRDGTAIEAREKPKKSEAGDKVKSTEQADLITVAEATESIKLANTKVETVAPAVAKADVAKVDIVEIVASQNSTPTSAVKTKDAKSKPGRKKKSTSEPPQPKRIEVQVQQTLPQMLREIPTGCDRGTKCNAQGYKVSWNGYKLHIDTADCGVAISALLSSASMHDSQAAIPLSLMTAERVTSCYDLMDAAYCSEILREHSRSLGHVPLIDHNPRRGEKKEFAPHEAERYKERTQAERTNARLKDEFGGNDIWVRGHEKINLHLMFGLLALTADQLMRLLT